MGVEIESEIWVPSKALNIFLFVSCFLSLFYLPDKTAVNVFDQASSASFHRFQRKFLAIFALSSVIQGSLDVLGEYEYTFYGANKDQILRTFCIGYSSSLIFGSFLGVLCDLIGHRRSCLLFLLLHLFISVWKILVGNAAIWLTYTSFSLASSLFSFTFETWMVVEHNKHVPRQDSLNDMYWLMTFLECTSFIGSQLLGNYLINVNPNKSTYFAPKEICFLVLVAIILVTRFRKENHDKLVLKDYFTSLHRHVFTDKRVWLVGCAQACVHFSTAMFWILWAPTVVGDGRQVSLGLIYSCFLGFKMFGSTCFPWFNGPLALRLEEYVTYAFVAMGLILAVVAYDYQDIEVLMILFYIFHACTGLVLPSLAKLRTMYVPNQVRGGMMCVSMMPANAALLLFLYLRRKFGIIENSTILAFAGLAMFVAAGCMLMLKRWGKQLHQSNHNL